MRRRVGAKERNRSGTGQRTGARPVRARPGSFFVRGNRPLCSSGTLSCGARAPNSVFRSWGWSCLFGFEMGGIDIYETPSEYRQICQKPWKVACSSPRVLTRSRHQELIP